MSAPLALVDRLPLVEAATDALVRSALVGGVLIAAVWLLCRMAPAIPPRVRAALWWTACLKLVVGCAWLAPVELPLLPAPETSALQASRSPDLVPLPTMASARTPESASASRTAVPADPDGPPARPLPWKPVALLLWLAGLMAGFMLDARSLHRLRGTIRRARPLATGPVPELFSQLAHRVGLAHKPRLLVSDEIRTPQAVGLLRPAVLLPTAALDASRSELAMVLAHELIHLGRRDLWLAWIPLLARRLFFFHPLAPLAQREHALAREAACDAEVLSALGTAPRAYGRLLVRWGVAPRETGLAAAGAAPSVHILKRRLQMLQSSSTTHRRSSPWWWLSAAALAVALVPVTIVAQAPSAPPAPPAPPEAPAPPADVALPAPEAPVLAAAAPVAPAPAALAAAPAAPAAPGPAPAPVTAPPAPPEAPQPPGQGVTWSWSDDGNGFALLDGNSDVWIHGSSTDSDRIRSLRKGNEPLLWFRRDGAEYIVRDRALIERARKILRPQMELAEQQAALGARQGELGAKQGELGARQGELAAKQGALGAQQAKLAAEQAALAGRGLSAEGDEPAELSGRRDELEGRMRELATRQRELAERQRELGAKQHELGTEQRELGEPQRELGERQRVLGERQRQAAERARGEIEALIDQAIVDKKAERID